MTGNSVTIDEQSCDRPKSCYSDIAQNENKYPNGNNNGSIQNSLDDQPFSPTQAVCLMTTVPQNIASQRLGDKHTPTRNSLRHSRLIGMYRNGRIPKKLLPFVIKHYKLVKSMKVITIIIGVLMCMLSIWLVLWSPTLNITDYPYWSAATVFCSGVIGCFFLGFCPKPYPGKQLGCHYHLTKGISIVATSISIVTIILVLTTSIIHLVYIHTATCSPQDKFNTTCICSINNSTGSTLFNESYHYEDFTCEELDCFLKGLLATSCVLNVLALLLECSYLCVLWHSREKFVYTKVPLRQGNRMGEEVGVES